MSNISIKYHDLDITEVTENIEISGPYRVTPMTISKRHGAVISEVVVLDPKRISIRGIISENNFDTLITTLDNMSRTFAKFNKKFRIFDDRYFNAYPLSFNYTYLPGTILASAAFTCDFFCADPFAYSDTPISDSRVTSSDTFALNNTGNAFVYPIFTITAGGSSITSISITNNTTGRNITYSNTLLAGGILIIDCTNFIVINNGTEDLTNFSGSFLWLNPGSNELIFTSNNSATWATSFTPRFY